MCLKQPQIWHTQKNNLWHHSNVKMNVLLRCLIEVRILFFTLAHINWNRIFIFTVVNNLQPNVFSFEFMLVCSGLCVDKNILSFYTYHFNFQVQGVISAVICVLPGVKPCPQLKCLQKYTDSTLCTALRGSPLANTSMQLLSSTILLVVAQSDRDETH